MMATAFQILGLVMVIAGAWDEFGAGGMVIAVGLAVVYVGLAMERDN